MKQAHNEQQELGNDSAASFVLMNPDRVLRALHSRTEGLSAEEAAARRTRWGSNVLPQRGREDALAQLILRQCKSTLIVILLIAAAVSFVLDDHADAYVILLAVFINVGVGTYQERKASHALKALKDVVTAMARVVREGRTVSLPQADVVPGDVIVVQAGDRVPADARVIEAHALEANEAALTGESHPQAKSPDAMHEVPVLAERTNMLYLGTVATAGKGTAVVTGTGSNTEMGKIASLLAATAEERTPLQRQLDRFARLILAGIVGVVIVLFVIGVSRGERVPDMLIASIAVAVSAIPEGLTIALTVILALGMQETLKKKGLVRSLLAAESLGATSVICTDKTGTLTTGNMAVVRVEGWRTAHDFLPGKALGQRLPRQIETVISLFALCNDAAVPGDDGVIATGNATDRALLQAALLAGIDVHDLRQRSPRLREKPFDSQTKYMLTVHAGNLLAERNVRDRASETIIVKGATEALVPKITHALTADGEAVRLKKHDLAALTEQVERMSKEGLRVLCVTVGQAEAETKHPHATLPPHLTFIGFAGIKDPVREGVSATIAAAVSR